MMIGIKIVLLILICYFIGNKFDKTLSSKKIKDHIDGFITGLILFFLFIMFVGVIYAISYSIASIL